jgi:hypothetical protein
MIRLHWLGGAIYALLVLAGVTPARAQNEHSNPHAFDNPGHSDNGGGNGNGGGGGNGNGGNGNGNGNGNGVPSGGSVTTPSAGVGGAGAAGQASGSSAPVPLESVLSQVDAVTDGKVIDARIITARGYLLYEIRVLEPNDSVHRLYFYARSGRPVE